MSFIEDKHVNSGGAPTKSSKPSVDHFGLLARKCPFFFFFFFFFVIPSGEMFRSGCTSLHFYQGTATVFIDFSDRQPLQTV